MSFTMQSSRQALHHCIHATRNTHHVS